MTQAFTTFTKTIKNSDTSNIVIFCACSCWALYTVVKAGYSFKAVHNKDGYSFCLAPQEQPISVIPESRTFYHN